MRDATSPLYGIAAALWATTVAAYLVNGGDALFDTLANEGVLGAQFLPQGSTPPLFTFMGAVALLCAYRSLRSAGWVKFVVIVPVAAWSALPFMFLSPWPERFGGPHLTIMLEAVACAAAWAAVVYDFMSSRRAPH